MKLLWVVSTLPQTALIWRYKIRCNNVGGLEHRLINIEGELSRLTTLLAAVGNPRTVENAISQLPVAQDNTPILSVDTHVEEDTGILPTDRHIVRSQRHHLDFYHGPCTLFALCNKFRDTALESIASSNPEEAQRVQDGGFDDQSSVKELLANICLEAGMEDSFDLHSEQAPVRLPPKQFLMMAQAQFFTNVDYSTDIFVQSSFCSKINEIYGRPFTASDESWAICFNTIILLVLGSETAVQGNDGLLGSQFIRPFMLAVHAALSKSYILMGPKLINVQTMALLVSPLVKVRHGKLTTDLEHRRTTILPSRPRRVDFLTSLRSGPDNGPASSPCNIWWCVSRRSTGTIQSLQVSVSPR